jgi:cysteinyl-tRNA synthetase
MSMATLLEPFGGGLECDDPNRNVFDIHGGGIDLVFPHHENEIAQSCCAFGSRRMANVWLHNGFLQVESEKMAKSLGNFVTIHELLTMGKFGSSTWPGEVMRLAMLRTHYRQPIDWTVKELQRAYEFLNEWYGLLDADTSTNGAVDQEVLDALSDDLNTHAALVRVHGLAKTGDFAALRASLGFLGFSGNRTKLRRDYYLFAEPATLSLVPGSVTMFVVRGDGTIETDPSTQRFIDDRIARRNAARAARNFAEADKLRDELAALGVAIRDNKDGTTTWEPKR